VRAAIVSKEPNGRCVTTDHLLRYHYDSFRGESSVAVIKKVFQRGSKKINDQDVVKAFLAEVIDIRDSGYCTLVLRTQSICSIHSRQPTRILYVRYSSRNCGASLFRGS